MLCQQINVCNSRLINICSWELKSDYINLQIWKKKMHMYWNSLTIIYCFLDWKIAHHFNKHKHTVDWLCQQILHVCACISIITLTGRCSLGGGCQVPWFCRLCWIFFFSQLFEIKSFYFKRVVHTFNST